MLGKRQFSIQYLLLETLWIALAIGMVRLLAKLYGEPVSAGPPSTEVVLAIASIFFAPMVISTAVFGLFGYMRTGAIVGSVFTIIGLPFFLFPTVR